MPGRSAASPDLGEAEALLKAAGRLWQAGVELDFARMAEPDRRRRIPLPTYPFERRRYWIAPRPPPGSSESAGAPQSESPDQELHPRPALQKAYLAPRTPEESLLAGVWSSLLGLDRAGVEDNFFELGGDSILGIQLATRARNAGRRAAWPRCEGRRPHAPGDGHLPRPVAEAIGRD